MFEVGFTEILLISILALVVLGPEKLPRVAAQLGRWMGRARSMARQFREQLEDEVQLAEANKPKPASSSTSTDGSTQPSDSSPNVIYPEHTPPASADATNAPPPEVSAANSAAAETAHSDSSGPPPEPEAAVYQPPAYAQPTSGASEAHAANSTNGSAHAGSSVGTNDGASSTAHTSTVESPAHSDDPARKPGDFITTTHERGL
jgi:sec-independent protein translocase protein TatB